jgi:prepilin-type N-terminal cleavage/methylation domain-containing protein
MRRRTAGFTLIELLAVMAIIGVLVALLLPVLRTARNKARAVRAKAEVNQLAMAWNSYLNDYRKWDPTGQSPAVDTGSSADMDAQQVSILRGSNPRTIKYMDFDAASTNGSGEFIDPWGRTTGPAGANVFQMRLDGEDGDYDGSVVTPHGTVYRSVAVWSRGPDGADNTAQARADDVKSWE